MGWKDTTECILSKILTEGENLDLDRMELSWVKWLEPNWYMEAMTGLYRQKKIKTALVIKSCWLSDRL